MKVGITLRELMLEALKDEIDGFVFKVYDSIEPDSPEDAWDDNGGETVGHLLTISVDGGWVASGDGAGVTWETAIGAGGILAKSTSETWESAAVIATGQKLWGRWCASTDANAASTTLHRVQMKFTANPADLGGTADLYVSTLTAAIDDVQRLNYCTITLPETIS